MYTMSFCLLLPRAATTGAAALDFSSAASETSAVALPDDTNAVEKPGVISHAHNNI